MASLVQRITGDYVQWNSYAGTTQDLKFPSNLSVGSVVIIAYNAYWGGGAPTPGATDAAGNTYQVAPDSNSGTANSGTPSTYPRAVILYGVITTGGIDTVTVTGLPGGGLYGQVTAEEWEGLEPPDRAGGAHLAGPTSTDANFTTGILASQPQLVVASLVIASDGDSNVGITGPSGAGWTNVYRENNAAANTAGSVDRTTVTATTAVSVQYSHNNMPSGAEWALAVATFPIAGSAGPSITSVDSDNTITSDQTNVVITGTDFDAATVEIRQGAVEIAQSIDSQNATTIQFDVVFEGGASDLKYGSATLAVINDDDQEDTIAITIEPPSGQLYVDVSTPNAESDYRITAVDDIESGDQIQARGEGGGAAPAGLTLNADATFGFSEGNTPAAFDVRVWDVNDATWGAWATQSIAASVEQGEISAAAEADAVFAASSARAVSFSAGVEAGLAMAGQAAAMAAISAGVDADSALSGRAVALASITEALEAGDVGNGINAVLAAFAESLEADAQMAALAQAAAAIQAGLEAGEEWAAIAAAEAGLLAGAELGASFLAETQGAQSAALSAGTEAAASFLGAVAAFGLLSAGAEAGDAFSASASISGAWSAGAQMGAAFGTASANDVGFTSAADVQAQFLAAIEGAGLISEPVSADSAFGGVSAALALLSAGVFLGADFTAVSSADFSVVGAVATVRAIHRISADVRPVGGISTTIH